jgi:NodT family efflux transporter outer membrane factor (OMF) lipoprotein
MRYNLKIIINRPLNSVHVKDFLLFKIILIFLLLYGCKAVGPDYIPVDPTMPDAWTNEITSKFEEESQSTLEVWWTVFNDPTLNTLIDQAKRNNKNLKTAYSRILQARSGLSGVKGAKYPYATLGANTGFSKMSDNGALSQVAPDGGFQPQAHFRVGLSASWEIDFFGKVKRSIESGSANVEASIEDYYDAMVILFAEVTTDYINIRVNQQRIIIANQNIESQQKMTDLTLDRYEAGLSSYLDVVQSRSNLNQTQATIPEFQMEISNSLNQISVLIGVLKDSLDPDLFEVGKIPISTDSITTGIPINLLRQRPDIRAAERRIAASNAQIGVNKANLYPSFNLAGFFGFGTKMLTSLFAGGSILGGASSPISWQIFNRAEIKANIAISEEQTTQSLLEYENIVIEAIAEVDQSIAAYNLQNQRHNYLNDAVTASKEAVVLVSIQYEQGLTDFQNVLDTQRTLFDQQDNLIASEGSAVIEMVSLYKSLGGGWEVNSDIIALTSDKK